MDVTILLATIDEAENLAVLVPRLRQLFAADKASLEIVVIDGRSKDGTPEVARRLGCVVRTQSGPGYAQAIRDGVAAATGDYVIVMDADLSHDPEDAFQLYRRRGEADIVINSRYVSGGGTDIEAYRDWLSRTLNWLYRRVLRLPFREISGGFRIYRREILGRMPIESRFYEVQEELIIKAHWMGYRAVEIPYRYRERAKGVSKAKVLKYGVNLLRALWRFRVRERELREILAKARSNG